MEQPIRRRRPWGSGSAGTVGLGTAAAGRGSRPPDLEEFLRRSQDRLRGLLPGNLGGRGIALIALVAGRAVGLFRLLPRRARRARRGAALRQIHPRGAAGTELSPALSDRDRADAAGAAHQQDRHRHAPGRRHAPRHVGARGAGGKPDAHRRREHRRRRFLGAVEGQADRRRRLSVQHPESRRHREGGRRSRHARGDRALDHPADPHRRAPEHRDRRCRN